MASADYTVNTAVDDANPQSLRWAIGQANSAPANIVSDGGTYSITLASALPSFTQTYTIDAATPKLTITGNSAGYLNFSVDSGKTIDMYSTVTGSAGLTKTGLGTLELLGTVGHTGSTTISAGDLNIAADMANTTGISIADSAILGLIGAETYTKNITLTGNATINTTADAIQTGAISGAFGLTKTGANTLTLSNLGNTFSGTMTISAGSLVISNTGNLTGASFISLGAGTLGLAGAMTFTKAIELTNSSAAISTTNADSTISGQITGGFNLHKTGARALTLGEGFYPFSGIMYIDAGTLNISNSQNLLFISSLSLGAGTLGLTAGFAFSHPITLADNAATISTTGGNSTILGHITGGFNLTKTGINALALSASNTYSGLTTISAGTLNVVSDGSTGTGTDISMADSTILGFILARTYTKNITLTGNATINTASDAIQTGTISESGGSRTLTKTGVRALTLTYPLNTYSGTTTISAGTLNVSSDGNTGTGTDISMADSTTLGLTGAGTYTKNITLTGNATINITADVIQTGTISGAFGLTKTGANTLTLTSGNSYTGTTTVTTGTLILGNNTGMIASTPLVVNGTFDISAGLSDVTVTSLTGSGDIITAASHGLIIDQAGSSSFSGIVSGSGGTLEKKGVGTQTLTNTNTYTGTTTVTAGTLTLGSNTGMIASTPLVVNGTFDISAGLSDVTVTSLTGSGGITTAASHGLIIDQAGSSSFSGIVSGSGGTLEKKGVGTQTLTNTNTYTGTTMVTAGTLTLGNNTGMIASTPLVVNGTFDISAGAGPVTVKSVTDDGLGNGIITTALGHDLVIDHAAGTSSFKGTIGGAGGLTKTGVGTQILTNINLYTGTTTVDAGTLALGSGSGFIASTPVVVNSSATLDISDGIGALMVKSIDDGTSGGGTITLGNKALIINRAGGTSTFSGSITGTSGVTKLNTGTQIFTGANAYSGGTTVTGGILQGNTNGVQGNIINNAAVVFDQTGVGTYSGAMSGTGTLTKTGSGDVIIADGSVNTLSGTTYVNEGRMLVRGTLPGPMVVNTQGTLGGNGYCGTVTNHGIVAPGESIGTIHIIGDYNQAADGALAIEIDNVTHDYVYVAGVANLNGAVNISGLYLRDVVYTILTANGGVNGIFSSSTVNPPTDRYNIFYTHSSALFTTDRNAVRAEETPLSGNPLLVQNYLEYVRIDPFSDLYNVMSVLCCSIPYSEYIEALNELHPAVFSTVPELKYNNQYDAMNTFSQRLRTAYTGNQLLGRQDRASTKRLSNKLTAWIQPLGYVKHKKTVEYDRGYDAQEAGIMLGTDYRCGKHLLLGVGGGYTRDHSQWHYPLAPVDRSPDTVIHSGFFGAYGELYGKYWYLNASALGSHNTYIYRRRINFGTIDRTATSTHQGLAWSAHVEGGIHYPCTKYKIYLEPTVWLDEFSSYEKGFTETGADSLNMIVDGKDTRMRQVCAGVRIYKDFTWRRFMFEPKITLGALHDTPLNNTTYIARYVDQTDVLTVYGTDLKHSLAVVGADLRMGFKKDRSSFAGIHYEAHMRRGYHSHHASFEIEKTF